jgi:DNA gyrase subunit A
MIENPDIDVDGLMEHIPGPDFPTGAIINGRAGILLAYRTGRGRIYIRSKYHIEEDSRGKASVVVTEIPYQLNKARLIEKIAELVKEKKLEGITELRDESDKDGMRIVIELRRGEMPDVIANNLFAQTQMEGVFGINIVALVDGQPKILNLRELIENFIRHRREVVTRRTVFELRKARERGHVLEGLAIALANIDEIIELIRQSPTPADAKEGLIARAWVLGSVSVMLEQTGDDACRPEDLEPQYGVHDTKYHLSPVQAQAILDLRLHRLTGLEHEKLIGEYKELLVKIAELLEILGSYTRLMEIIREELEAVTEEYGDERKTEIIASRQDLTVADLITEEDMVVTISHGGYAKTQPLTDYQSQRRGGKGRSVTAVKDEDFVEHLLIASTHATILCFTNMGKVYWLKVYEIPQASRAARGRPIVNILPLVEGERISTILPVNEYSEDRFVFMATSSGIVKKTSLVNFSRPRSSGLIAVDLLDNDALIGAAITEGEDDIILVTNAGKVARFHESDVRAMGRTARGVKGVKMKGDAVVISLIIPKEGGNVLTASARGYGKQTPVEDFPCKGRGNQGVIGMQCTDRNGYLAGAVQVFEGDDVMLISDQGTMVRTRTSEISVLGRNTQGVTLIKVASDENLVSLARIEEPEESEILEGEDLEGESAVVTEGTVEDGTEETITDDE